MKMQNFKITIEKQKGWTKETMENKLSLGAEAFTITDLPFSSVLQAYWFLAGAILDIFLPKIFWQNTDTYFFYKNTMGKKSKSEIFSTFLKLHKKLLEHENTFSALQYTPVAIASVAANGHSRKFLENKIEKILEFSKNNSNFFGIFIVSGGGILQRFAKKYLNLLFNWPISSFSLFSFVRNKYTDLQIFAAANPNLANENLDKLLLKHKNIYSGKYENINFTFTQPPFIWSKFIKYLENINSESRVKNIQIQVGIPIFTSPWNVRFWMQLVGINWRKEKEAGEIVRLFEEKYNQDTTEKKEKFKEFSKLWTINLIKKIKDLQSTFTNISGIHLMPMGNYINIDELIMQETQYENIKYKNHFKELNSVKYEDRIYLDKEFVLQSKSIIWDFNLEFWNHLEKFMQALGRDYKKSIGGSADANENLIKYSASKFQEQLEKVEIKNITNSNEKYYLEIGAAGTEWAKDFIKACENKNYTYVFLDYSQNVLDKARKEMGEEYLNVKIEYFLVENNNFEKYAGKILRIHATNVYDNFPYDRIIYKNNNFYNIKVKTYISKENLNYLIEKYKAFDLSENIILNFLKELPKLNEQKEKYEFWQELWNFMKFEEMFEKTILDEKVLQMFQNLNLENLEFGNSTDAQKDILEKYELLVPGGCIEIIDIIVTELMEYKNFLGPVKYDASIANYINFPFLKNVLQEKYANIKMQIQSLKDFGGKRNQSILEITKE